MNKQDIPFLPATELASQIRERKISPVEAVEAYLERIEQVDPKLNAYITILRDEALKAARQTESESCTDSIAAFLKNGGVRYNPPHGRPRFCGRASR